MRVIWDSPADRFYSEGISQGMLYPENSPGVAWNGLISVSEKGAPSQEPKYYDGRKYYERSPGKSFSGVINAFTYPDELEPYIGISGVFTAQARHPFGFSYKASNALHIVYNVLAAPSKNSYVSAGENPDLVIFSWDFTTRPEKIPGGKATSHFVIMLDEAKAGVMADLEAKLYGDDENDPVLPPVSEIIDIFEAGATLRITDNGDGTWTAVGPDDVIIMLDDTTFEIDWSSVTVIDDTTYSVSSL